MEEQIEKRVKELQDYRKQLVEQANAEINRIDGGIAELHGVLEAMRESKAEPKREADSAA